MPNFVYSDINMSLLRHPSSWDIAKRYDVDSIKTSVKSILNTNKGEKLFNPTFGADLYRLLFELITPTTKLMAKRIITEEIQRWEPRILISDVVITTEEEFGTLYIYVGFVLKENTAVADSVTVNLERVR